MSSEGGPQAVAVACREEGRSPQQAQAWTFPAERWAAGDCYDKIVWESPIILPDGFTEFDFTIVPA